MLNKFNITTEINSKILLHACCAPCALSPAPEFEASEDIDYDVFFYNPNIFDEAEHDKRLGEVKKISEIFKFRLFIQNDEYSKFLEYAAGLENEPEGGTRCVKCFEMRLAAAFKFASAGGYKCVATTLTTSPHKNASLINSLGRKIAAGYDNAIRLIEFDFKKNNGFKSSIDYCKKYSIYRQNYCGCHFSKR
jgi:hypothetical protein